MFHDDVSAVISRTRTREALRIAELKRLLRSGGHVISHGEFNGRKWETTVHNNGSRTTIAFSLPPLFLMRRSDFPRFLYCWKLWERKNKKRKNKP